MCSVMTRSNPPARLFMVSHLFHHFSALAHFYLFFPPASLHLHFLTPRQQQLTPQCLTPNQSERKPTLSAPPTPLPAVLLGSPLTRSSSPKPSAGRTVEEAPPTVTLAEILPGRHPSVRPAVEMSNAFGRRVEVGGRGQGRYGWRLPHPILPHVSTSHQKKKNQSGPARWKIPAPLGCSPTWPPPPHCCHCVV